METFRQTDFWTQAIAHDKKGDTYGSVYADVLPFLDLNVVQDHLTDNDLQGSHSRSTPSGATKKSVPHRRQVMPTKPWPGTQENIFRWIVLENNVAIGWEHNPETGWEFHIIPYPKV